jgi:ribose-phosphate pyrophosphokinase
VAYATHAVLSGAAIDNLNNSQLDELVVTNSIPLSKEAKQCAKIRVLPIGPLLAESIRRISNKESISAMFL